MKTLDTQHWKLRVLADYVRINVTHQVCTNCHGRGEIGGGFKSIDGPESCPSCGGRGEIMDSVEDKPKLPKDFVAHMSKAYQDYINGD